MSVTAHTGPHVSGHPGTVTRRRFATYSLLLIGPHSPVSNTSPSATRDATHSAQQAKVCTVGTARGTGHGVPNFAELIGAQGCAELCRPGTPWHTSDPLRSLCRGAVVVSRKYSTMYTKQQHCVR